ncbi:MAG: DUF748 domain-containing protein [Clostridia bacterium]|nr:DUF748 domain-containing protein [Deltaproteobacteria bacterium]
MALRKKSLIGVATLVVVFVIARLIAPFVITHFMNKKLEAMPDYWGHIDGVGLSLWRGAYQIYDLQLAKRGAPKSQKPLLLIPTTDIGVNWKALFDGNIVATVTLIGLRINFVTEDSKAASTAEKPPESLGETLKSLVALEIQKFEIIDGSVHYIDEREKPVVDLKMTDMHALVLGLRTRPGEGGQDKHPTRGEITSTIQKSGRLKASFRANMFAPKHPTGDGEMALRLLPLTELVDFTRAYGGFDFEAGTMSVYAEAAIGVDDVAGYIKPIISGKKVLDVHGNDKGDNILELAWEGFVAGVTSLLENHGTDDIATRVKFKGSLDDPKVGTWGAVWSILGNAFLRAILPGVDQTVTLADVTGGSRPHVTRSGKIEGASGGSKNGLVVEKDAKKSNEGDEAKTDDQKKAEKEKEKDQKKVEKEKEDARKNAAMADKEERKAREKEEKEINKEVKKHEAAAEK